MRMNRNRTRVIGGSDVDMIKVLSKHLGFTYKLVKEKFASWHPEGMQYLVTSERHGSMT